MVEVEDTGRWRTGDEARLVEWKTLETEKPPVVFLAQQIYILAVGRKSLV